MTVANYVHLVEPQWNPSVEEQAIARAVRMGQTRPVTVMRYIVRRTVEEVHDDSTNLNKVRRLPSLQNILILQQKKSTLAKFTLDSGPEEGESGKLEVRVSFLSLTKSLISPFSLHVSLAVRHRQP